MQVCKFSKKNQQQINIMTKTPENHSFKNLENHTSKTQKITPTKPTKSQLQSLENQYLRNTQNFRNYKMRLFERFSNTAFSL